MPRISARWLMEYGIGRYVVAVYRNRAGGYVVACPRTGFVFDQCRDIQTAQERARFFASRSKIDTQCTGRDL
jgi:hypothetical protein